jgi:hypothetical protein
MNKLLHEVADSTLEARVMSSNLLPLVRELRFKYGLMVFAQSVDFVYGNHGKDSHDESADNFLLCDEQGLALGRIFMYEDTYCYHTPFIAKERGADDFDRHTYRSKKLSTLMTTLKRCEFPTTSNAVVLHKRIADSLVEMVRDSFLYQSKRPIEGERAHELLLAMKAGKAIEELPVSSRDYYLELLDNYQKSDILRDERKQGVIDMFKDCYFIMGDTLGQYIVTETTHEINSKNELVIKFDKPFRRVKDLQEYPRALSALTMLKVHLGENFHPFARKVDNHLIPYGDKYLPDLELVYGYRNRDNAFSMGAVCMTK